MGSCLFPGTISPMISRFPCLCRWSGFAVHFGSVTGEVSLGQSSDGGAVLGFADFRRHKRGDNQIDRARVREVRIQSPPAESQTNFGTWVIEPGLLKSRNIRQIWSSARATYG